MRALSQRLRGDLAPLLLLAALPVVAHAPAWTDGRLLGPGDGAALHFPLRTLVWQAFARGELPSWNPWIFLGTPLLAAYRPGAFYPPMFLLAGLHPFAAFQALVLASLAATSVLVFLYLRRLGAHRVGAYFSGLSFALGPYLVGHLGDTATVVAAPLLPLVLLAAESHMNRATPGRAIGLSSAIALLLLAGSPEAARAGLVLAVGRLVIGHFLPPASARPPSLQASALAILAGVLLAGPQLVPSLLAARDAGRAATGTAADTAALVPGATGLVLRYVSHTPAPSLALAALPLMLTHAGVRVLGLALALSVALQWGRGPLSAPGTVALVFDLTLSILAGLSLSAQWRARRDAQGRRLRAYVLVASLASAAALSVAAAALGPLPETLTGAVGVLALSFILYFSLAESPRTATAGVWLLPLTVSFVLQPYGRRVWEDAPTRAALYEGSGTREALQHAMEPRAGQREIALVRRYPKERVLDLAYGNFGLLAGRRSANGYDPMTPLRNRAALGGMSASGALPAAFLRSHPARLETLGVRWVQLPAEGLVTTPQAGGLGDRLDLPILPGQPRFLPLPVTTATEVRVGTSLSDAVDLPDGTEVARLRVRLASGRDLALTLRAGIDTAEWAYDRPDVRARVRHRRPVLLESWTEPAGFPGHQYAATLALPGRYLVDGLFVEHAGVAARLTLFRMALFDATTGVSTPVALASAYVSDTTRLREAASTPAVRLFEVTGPATAARLVAGLRRLPGDEDVLEALSRGPEEGGLLRGEAAARAGDVAGLAVPEGARVGRAEVVRAEGGRIEVRAEGPGLLVVAEGWDSGWTATVDGGPAPLFRVNHAQMALPLAGGVHRVVLAHRARGLAAGTVLAAAAALSLALWWVRGGRARS